MEHRNSARYVLVLVCLLAFAQFSFAEDIIATTSNGSTVILHDNGRWEYYQNNARIRDVRESAVPKDARFEVSVLYEPAEKVKKNVRMALEADFATEEEIKDSLRKVPKGGYIYFQVPTKQIKSGITPFSIRARPPSSRRRSAIARRLLAKMPESRTCWSCRFTEGPRPRS